MIRKRVMLKPVKMLLLLVILAVTHHRALGTPAQPFEMSEEGKRLLQRVQGLDAQKDVEGLLGALEAAQKLPPRDPGRVIPKIIDALGRVDPKGLKNDKVVAALAPVAKEYHRAVGLLAKIGTEDARRVVADLAKTGPNKDIRHMAIAWLGRFKSPDMIRLLIQIASDKKEKPELRGAALRGLERSSLTGEQYRTLFRIAEDLSDPMLFPVLRLPARAKDPNAISPLIETIGKFSERIESQDPKVEVKAIKAFERGMWSLTEIAREVSKHVGYSIHLAAGDVSVSRGKKLEISYHRTHIIRHLEDRKRVLEFWSGWWHENREAVLHPEAKAREAPWMREKDPARRLYLQANALDDQRKFAEAGALYRKVINAYPGSSVAYQSQVFLSRIEAVQGKPAEAFKTLLAARLSDLKKAGTPPRTQAELEILHARVRVKVAEACADAGTIDGLETAKAQYEKLIADTPNSPLVPRARRRIKELTRQIPLELSRRKEREILTSIVKSLEKALNEKDVKAYLAWLAPSADVEKVRQQIEQAFKNPRFVLLLPITYVVDRVDFNDDMTEATVQAGVKTKTAGSAQRDKRRGKTFRFVKTPKGWKLKAR